MSAPGSLSPELQTIQKEGRAVELWTVGIFCVLGWDYLMCLPKEIKHIWKKKFTYISALYLANRYFGLLQATVDIAWIMNLHNAGLEAETCRKIFRWQPVGAMIVTLLSQAIMASRVYALYGLSKPILGALATIMAAEFAIQAYTLTLVFPAPSFPGLAIQCVAIAPYKWLVAFWAMPLLFDTVTFFLTLFRTFTFWRQEVHTPTITLIFRDGLIYFAAVFTMNLVNVIIFTTQDAVLQSINLPATMLLNIILSCRLVLNLRKPRAKIHMTGATSSLTASGGTGGGERQVNLWNSPAKPQVNSYELSSSTTPTTAGVAIVTTKTDTFV